MHMQRMMRRRHRGWRLLAVVAVFTIGYLGIVLHAIMFKSHLGASIDDDTHLYSRKLLATNTTDDDGGFQYPPDAFSIAQRKKGAVVLHVIGLIYMFVALAIVCDEFFVPSLSVITDKLKISEDVAGATFMAAGGSAPELFTSLIGVFFAKNNVGIGTIVGSAVFNILFVIGMCALFSKTVLELTWWPLFRDVTFYSIDLAVLIGFFEDEEIQWWEALILFALYLSYVIFMKFNTTMEDFVKTKLLRRKARVHSNDSLLNEAAPSPVPQAPAAPSPVPQAPAAPSPLQQAPAAPSPLPQAPAAPSPVPQAPKPNRRCSIPILHSGTNHFRHGVLQLMIHTVDPISECQVQEKAIKLHAVASVNLLIDESPEHEGQNGNANGTADKNSNKKQMQVHAISNGHMPSESPVDSTNFSTQFVSPMTAASTPTNDAVGQSSSTTRQSNRTDDSTVESPQNEGNQEGAGILDDDSEPLDMSWPKTWRKRITYVIVAPLIVPMWLLLPDTRRPEKKKWFMVTFFGSIIFIFIYSYLMVWWANQTATFWTVPIRKEKKKWFMVTFFGSIIFIFIYSYLMVWWANQTGETMDIPDEVMGLTILAAGTSIPDLITSVIVAKKGFGDMAVSSSVGSNIFDITVGLPIPWLLYWMAFQKPINVESNGLVCSIILLFAMLLTVVITIAVSKWKMTKIMGGAMLGLYGVFVVLSVLLELDVISCFIN